MLILYAVVEDLKSSKRKLGGQKMLIGCMRNIIFVGYMRATELRR